MKQDLAHGTSIGDTLFVNPFVIDKDQFDPHTRLDELNQTAETLVGLVI